MQNKHKSFLVDHKQEVIDLLNKEGFTEQPAVITTYSEDSPMKIILIPELKYFFALCTNQEQTTIRIARAILGLQPERTDIVNLRKELQNG